MMIALDSGAEDFDVTDDGFEITTLPETFAKVCDALEENGVETLSAEVAMIPKTYTKLEDEEQIKKFEKMLEMFDDNDDVQDVYHNAELPDDYE